MRRKKNVERSHFVCLRSHMRWSWDWIQTGQSGFITLCSVVSPDHSPASSKGNNTGIVPGISNSAVSDNVEIVNNTSISPGLYLPMEFIPTVITKISLHHTSACMTQVPKSLSYCWGISPGSPALPHLPLPEGPAIEVPSAGSILRPSSQG